MAWRNQSASRKTGEADRRSLQLSLIFQPIAAGLSTTPDERSGRLLRLHRAGPSASLDKSTILLLGMMVARGIGRSQGAKLHAGGRPLRPSAFSRGSGIGNDLLQGWSAVGFRSFLMVQLLVRSAGFLPCSVASRVVLNGIPGSDGTGRDE